MIVHKGTLETGHYVCYFRNQLDGNWYKNDDKTVILVEETEVLKAQAYVLCYCKQHINLELQQQTINHAITITNQQNYQNQQNNLNININNSNINNNNNNNNTQ